MRKLFSAGATCAALLAVPGVAVAAPSSHGACRQAVHQQLIASSSEGTVGDAISDGFYGNEPNIVDPYVPDAGPNELPPGSVAGRVVPSQSPGPKKTLGDGTVVQGSSWGDVQQNVIKPACNG